MRRLRQRRALAGRHGRGPRQGRRTVHQGPQGGARGPVLDVRRRRARAAQARVPGRRGRPAREPGVGEGDPRPLRLRPPAAARPAQAQEAHRHDGLGARRLRDGAVVWVGGLATSVRTNTTRKGDMMAMLQLDDTRGLAEVMVFPRVYAKCAACVREDAVLKVKGRVEMKEGIPRIVALEMEELHLEPGPTPSTSTPALRRATRGGRPGRRSSCCSGIQGRARLSSSPATGCWKRRSGPSRTPPTCTPSSSRSSDLDASPTLHQPQNRRWSRFPDPGYPARVQYRSSLSPAVVASETSRPDDQCFVPDVYYFWSC